MQLWQDLETNTNTKNSYSQNSDRFFELLAVFLVYQPDDCFVILLESMITNLFPLAIYFSCTGVLIWCVKWHIKVRTFCHFVPHSAWPPSFYINIYCQCKQNAGFLHCKNGYFLSGSGSGLFLHICWTAVESSRCSVVHPELTPKSNFQTCTCIMFSCFTSITTDL